MTESRAENVEAIAGLKLALAVAVSIVEFHSGDPRLGQLIVDRIDQQMDDAAPEVAIRLGVAARVIADLSGCTINPRSVPN